MIQNTSKSKVRTESRNYFAALGAHIARIRQSQGYSQAELARRIGVSQQAVFAYEIGERRVSVLALVKLARTFRIGIEELATFARPVRAPKHKVSPWARRHAERLQALPKTQQRFVVKIIDNLEDRSVYAHRSS